MVGSACLAARAVLRSGAGLCVLATPASVAPVAMAKLTCEMVAPLPADADGSLAAAALEPLCAALADAQAAAIGPGLGEGAGTADLVHAFLPRAAVPIVIDADALNLLAGRLDTLGAMRVPVVLTPHPGEMARLAGTTSAAVQAAREETAVAFAARWGKIVVLKGQDSLVTDGVALYRNRTGNPGMATGGSGDVLTGILAGLLARGLAPLDAAVLGVWLHGTAGDIAAAAVGEESLIATDLLDHLPQAFRALPRAAGG